MVASPPPPSPTRPPPPIRLEEAETWKEPEIEEEKIASGEEEIIEEKAVEKEVVGCKWVENEWVKTKAESVKPAKMVEVPVVVSKTKSASKPRLPNPEA